MKIKPLEFVVGFALLGLSLVAFYWVFVCAVLALIPFFN